MLRQTWNDQVKDWIGRLLLWVPLMPCSVEVGGRIRIAWADTSNLDSSESVKQGFCKV
jgi:hypothetical protein